MTIPPSSTGGNSRDRPPARTDPVDPPNRPTFGALSMGTESTPARYRFSFGPWNISTGADPFGPPVRNEVEFGRKLKAYKELGFDAVQFHDDDIVPADLDWEATRRGVAAVKKIL